MLKQLSPLLFSALLVGCVAPPQKTDSFTVKQSKTAAEDVVYENAMKSWVKSPIPLIRDGYVVEKHWKGPEFSSVTVSRYGYGIAKQNPFAIVDITEISKKETSINVYEGDCAVRCYEDYTPEVRTWFNLEPKE